MVRELDPVAIRAGGVATCVGKGVFMYQGFIQGGKSHPFGKFPPPFTIGNFF